MELIFWWMIPVALLLAAVNVLGGPEAGPRGNFRPEARGPQPTGSPNCRSTRPQCGATAAGSQLLWSPGEC